MATTLPETIIKLMEKKHYPQKTTLLLEGNIASKLYLIQEGIVRMWHNHDGNDITLKFFQKHQLITSFGSFYRQEPSQFSIETLSDTSVLEISKQQLLENITQDELNALLVPLLSQAFIKYTDLFLDRIKHKPEERYQQLLQDSPKLLDLVPHHYLASYLGITPVSLSRIRQRQKENGRH